MTSVAISGITLGLIFGGALVGMLLRVRIPAEHFSADTRDVVKLLTGIAGTMTAMVLGLLVASANGLYDAERDFVVQLAANTVMLDRTLAHYGHDTQETRELLHASVVKVLERAWPREYPKPDGTKATSGTEIRVEELYDRIQGLTPKREEQHALQTEALKIATDTAQARWHLFAELGSSTPPAFLVLMISWLVFIFTGIGLFAPRNGTSFLALFVGAFVVSSATFLILELEQPFRGIIHISSEPLRNALSQLGR